MAEVEKKEKELKKKKMLLNRKTNSTKKMSKVNFGLKTDSNKDDFSDNVSMSSKVSGMGSTFGKV